MRRSILEWFLLGTLVLNLGVVLVTTEYGDSTPQWPWLLSVAAASVPIALAVLALWKMFQKHTSGLWLCLAFYAIQILAYHDAQGRLIGFTCGVTVDLRLNPAASSPLTLSISALALSVCSALALRRRLPSIETDLDG